jgi:hypothetical protein
MEHILLEYNFPSEEYRLAIAQVNMPQKGEGIQSHIGWLCEHNSVHHQCRSSGFIAESLGASTDRIIPNAQNVEITKHENHKLLKELTTSSLLHIPSF